MEPEKWIFEGASRLIQPLPLQKASWELASDKRASQSNQG